MILDGDKIPPHLLEDLLYRWQVFNAVPDLSTPVCGHPSAKRVWAQRLVDRLLCPGCFETALGVLALQVADGVPVFAQRCGFDGCDRRASITFTYDLPRSALGQRITLVSCVCAWCAVPPEDDGEAA